MPLKRLLASCAELALILPVIRNNYSSAIEKLISKILKGGILIFVIYRISQLDFSNRSEFSYSAFSVCIELALALSSLFIP